MMQHTALHVLFCNALEALTSHPVLHGEFGPITVKHSYGSPFAQLLAFAGKYK